MALPVTLSGISTAVACVGPYKSSERVQVTNYYPLLSALSHGFGLVTQSAGFPEKIGQTFVAPTTFAVNKVKLRLQKQGSPTDNLVLEIRDTSVTGTLLATSDNVAGSGISTNGSSPTTFTFSSPPTLTASGTYALVLFRDGSLSDTNFYTMYETSGTVYADGKRFEYVSGSWDSGSTTHDFEFAVLSEGNAYYIFGRDSSDIDFIVAQKATDPTSSFSTITSEDTLASDHIAYAAVQDGDVIHIGVSSTVGSSCFLDYLAFDMSLDAFTVSEQVNGTMDTSTSAGVKLNTVSLVRRSDGDLVFHFNGPRVANMGNSYSQVYTRTRTGVNTYNTRQQVSAGGQIDFYLPEAVLGVSDSTHLFYAQAAAAIYTQRTLNSSDTLQTVSSNEATSTAPFGFSGVSYNESGTQRVIVALNSSFSSVLASGTFDSANTPTIAGPNTIETNGSIGRLFVDTGDSNKVWALYRDSTDSDLYVENSTDDGTTWGSRTSAFTGTIANVETNLSVDGTIYQRGNDFVIPYVVNDNGTLKYNEYVVRSVVTDTLFAQAVM